MTVKDRLYAWLNQATFDPANGCRHSQPLLAGALGCSERTIIRAVQRLEAEGRIRVDRPRRKGHANTYYVCEWTPTLRSRTLAELRRIKRARGQCHPKRTPQPRRDQRERHPLNVRVPERTTAVVAHARRPLTAPIDLVRQRLEHAGFDTKGQPHSFMALCPSHEDRCLSLSVTEGDDHRVLLNCFAGCDTTRIVDALGLQMRDLFVPTAPGARRPAKRKPKAKRRPNRLPDKATPVERVLNRYAPNYRATASPNFWTATCRVCGGQVWLHAQLDPDTDRPDGPVTEACENGCVKDSRGRG